MPIFVIFIQLSLNLLLLDAQTCNMYLIIAVPSSNGCPCVHNHLPGKVINTVNHWNNRTMFTFIPQKFQVDVSSTVQLLEVSCNSLKQLFSAAMEVNVGEEQCILIHGTQGANLLIHDQYYKYARTAVTITSWLFYTHITSWVIMVLLYFTCWGLTRCFLCSHILKTMPQ